MYQLFMKVKQMGCGMTMLMALVVMYQYKNSVIGTALVAATVRVRQGLPTSCILFVFYVNEMIRLIKQGCPLDGFLSWLHIVVMMDDTVLLATSKQGMKNKIKLMYDFCTSHDMIVNNTKTKFMVVNGNAVDKEPIELNGNIIDYCKQYIYLGSPFTEDGSPSTAIKIHANNKMCHVLKFIYFVNRNNDVPFMIKNKIFDAALMSTILYGCESWLNGDLLPIEKQYKWCIKQLLGVRKTTTNDICMVELGLPPLKALVISRQRNFFKKMWLERNGMDDDPLIYGMQLLFRYNDAVSRLVRGFTMNDTNDIENAINKLKTNIIQNTTSNRMIFL